jgi:hypothetical protein
MGQISPTSRFLISEIVDFPLNGSLVIKRSAECADSTSQGIAIAYEDGFPVRVAVISCGRIQSLFNAPIEIPPLIPPCHYLVAVVCGTTNFYQFLSCKSECCDYGNIDFGYRWDGVDDLASTGQLTKIKLEFVTPGMVELRDSEIEKLREEKKELEKKISELSEWRLC